MTKDEFKKAIDDLIQDNSVDDILSTICEIARDRYAEATEKQERARALPWLELSAMLNVAMNFASRERL